MRTTKQARKYNIKTEESKPKEVKPKAPKAKEEVPQNYYKVLIDNANYLPQKYSTYAEADAKGRALVGNSGSRYVVVEGRD